MNVPFNQGLMKYCLPILSFDIRLDIFFTKADGNIPVFVDIFYLLRLKVRFLSLVIILGGGLPEIEFCSSSLPSRPFHS